MAFIPKDARWYLADVVLEHIIGGDKRNVVHVNTHLVEAGSPEEAYRKALRLGREQQRRYLNMDRRQVQIRFWGLSELNVIHDELEDGAELSYWQGVDVPESELRRRVKARRQLGVFSPHLAGIGTCWFRSRRHHRRS